MHDDVEGQMAMPMSDVCLAVGGAGIWQGLGGH